MWRQRFSILWQVSTVRCHFSKTFPHHTECTRLQSELCALSGQPFLCFSATHTVPCNQTTTDVDALCRVSSDRLAGCWLQHFSICLSPSGFRNLLDEKISWSAWPMFRQKNIMTLYNATFTYVTFCFYTLILLLNFMYMATFANNFSHLFLLYNYYVTHSLWWSAVDGIYCVWQCICIHYVPSTSYSCMVS